MKKIKFLSILALTSAVIFTNSCKKNTNEVDTETQSVVDNSICEQEFMQIQPAVNNMAIKTKGTGAQRLAPEFQVMAACDSLTYVSGDTSFVLPGSPPTFKFDYGACSAANVDGVGRTGTITVTFYGKPKLPGSKAVIKLLSLKINGAITYSCDSIIVTTITNTISTKSFNVKVVNGLCTGNGWNIKYSSDKTITVSTNNTPALSDDVVTVTGSSNGTNRNNVDFAVTVNSLTKPANCKWITSGTLDITPSGLSTRTVDYGNGNCDDDATFTVNGQTIAFKLK